MRVILCMFCSIFSSLQFMPGIYFLFVSLMDVADGDVGARVLSFAARLGKNSTDPLLLVSDFVFEYRAYLSVDVFQICG